MSDTPDDSQAFSDIAGRFLLNISNALIMLTDNRRKIFPNHRDDAFDGVLKILSIDDAVRLKGSNLLWIDPDIEATDWLLFEGNNPEGCSDLFVLKSIINCEATNEEFVKETYTKVLARPADQTGFDLYTSMLSAGKLTRDEFIKTLVSSVESRSRNGQLALVGCPSKHFDDIENVHSRTHLSFRVMGS